MPLERRNTIATVPAHVAVTSTPHHHHSASFGTSSATTITASSTSYTSIKDVIAASGSAPMPGFGGGNGEIAIRNHLVNRAAWAYLQPMSTSPESGADHLLCRVATMVITPIVSLLRSAASAITRAFGCLWF